MGDNICLLWNSIFSDGTDKRQENFHQWTVQWQFRRWRGEIVKRALVLRQEMDSLKNLQLRWLKPLVSRELVERMPGNARNAFK